MLIGLLSLSFGACSSTNNDLKHAPESNRTRTELNHSWRYISADPANANAVYYDDSKWSTVRWLCTNVEGGCVDNKESNCVFANKHGVAWYRRHITLEAYDGKQKVFLEFDVLNSYVDVYINGVFLGKNKKLNSPLGFDLTPYINAKSENVIAVRVKCKDKVHNDSEPQHSIYDARSIYSAISPNVFLYSLDPLHITLPIYDNMKTHGVKVYANSVSAYQADVVVDVELYNEYLKAKVADFETHIYDEKGKLVSQTYSQQTIGGGKKLMMKHNLQIKDPHFWERNDPYLYTVLNIIRNGDEVLDTYTTHLGLDDNAIQSSASIQVGRSPQ